MTFTIKNDGAVEVTLRLQLDEPVIGPFAGGIDKTEIAVHLAGVVFMEGTPEIPSGRAQGHSVLKGGGLGKANRTAYGFRYRDLPEDVREALEARYAEVVRKAAEALNVRKATKKDR